MGLTLSVTGRPGRFSAEDMTWVCLEALFLLLCRGRGLEVGRPGKVMVGTGVAEQVVNAGVSQEDGWRHER